MEQEEFSWKQMTWKQRWQYFMDYYFKITLVILVVLAMLISLIKTICFDRKETMMSIMMVNENMDFDQQTMAQELCQKMGWTEKNQELSFSFLTTGTYQNEVVLITRVQARSVDLLITDRNTFDMYVKKGFFDDIRNYLPEGMDQEYGLITGSIEELDENGSVIQRGEETAYGIDLSSCERYRELGGLLEDPVLGVVVNGEHLDAVDETLEWLMK